MSSRLAAAFVTPAEPRPLADLHLSDGALTCLLTLTILLGSVSPLRAAVTVYTSLASFQAAAPSAALLATFESRATGPVGTFTEGGLTFSSPLSMYIISPAVTGTTNPPPPSKMLSASGRESFFASLSSGVTYSLGLTILTNRFGPHTLKLYDGGNAVFYTYLTTQAPNTVGFVGFVSTTPISKMHWASDRGETENTALDNFYAAPEDPTPTTTSTWGRIKALYR